MLAAHVFDTFFLCSSKAIILIVFLTRNESQVSSNTFTFEVIKIKCLLTIANKQTCSACK